MKVKAVRDVSAKELTKISVTLPKELYIKKGDILEGRYSSGEHGFSVTSGRFAGYYIKKEWVKRMQVKRVKRTELEHSELRCEI